MDLVFKALADPTRRLLLDRLHDRNGQTLGELCRHLEMTRQSATQHLEILAAANLVATVRRGREKFHYLNPVPLQEIEERWIDKFERPRLQALRTVQRRAEEAMTDKPAVVYVIYIESTPERVWQALTDAELTAKYWGHSNVSDWQVGSGWEHQRVDASGIADVTGTVVESSPPTRLVTTWAADGQDPADGHPRQPRRRRREGGRRGSLGGRALQPQVHDRNGPRPAAAAVGDAKEGLATGFAAGRNA